MSSELNAALKEWVEGEENPKSFYDVLGLPLLDPNVAHIQELIDIAAEFLIKYQNNHKDESIRKRATKIRVKIAEGGRLLRNPKQLEKFEQELVIRLWIEAWDQFLERFEQSRRDEVADICEKYSGGRG